MSFRLTGKSFDLVEQEHQAEPAQRSALLARRVLRRPRLTAGHRLAIWLCATSMFLLVFSAMVVFGVRSGSFGRVAATVALGGLLLFARHQDHRQAARDLAALGTLPRACVACAFDLSGLSAAEDGCTVCPECGAAWKLGPDARLGAEAP